MNASTPAVEAVIDRVKRTYRGWGRGTTVARMRDDWDRLFAAVDLDAVLDPVDAGGVPALWVSAPGVPTDRVLVYFHGGGFQVGSTRSHTELMAEISRAARCRVLGLDYRLAPEHRFPAPVDDARRAWDWLLTQGFLPSQLALGGDSAGGNLALALMLTLVRDEAGLPACAVLMSTWTDLTASGDAYASRAALDPIHQRPMIQAMARNYLGPEGDPKDPLASPLFAPEAELAKLPPLLIQVGDRETVRSDSTDFADRVRRAGGSAVLEVWDDMIHVFQQFPNELVEARRAIAAIGEFVRKQFNPKESPR